MIPSEDAAAVDAATPASRNGNGANASLPKDPAAERRSQWAYLAIALVAYIAFGLIVPTIHFRWHRMPLPEVIAIAVGPTLIFMLLQVWIPWCYTRIRQSFKAEIVEAVAFGLLWLLMAEGFRPQKGDSPFLIGTVHALANVAPTLALSAAGTIIARVIREAKLLLPLGIIAGLIDIVGAMTPVGFTAQMVQNHPEVVSKVSVHVPTMAGLPVGSMIGPGDPLFIAFFFAVVHQHRLNTRGTFGLVYVLLTISMIAVQLRLLPAVGALAPLGIAIIIANWKYFSFSREEKFAMLYASIISVAGAIAFFLYTKAHVFHKPKPAPPAQTAPGAPSTSSAPNVQGAHWEPQARSASPQSGADRSTSLAPKCTGRPLGA